MDTERIRQLAIEDRLVKFYQCSAWRKLRAEVFRDFNYECKMCKDKGKFSKAKYGHHIVEIKDFKNKGHELALVKENIIPLCFFHHEEQHPNRFGNKPKRNPFINEERW